ncbi:hypothetical protein [Desulfofundulus thermosubterraneus]|uniref:Uncharacterized protein n=1 Tax=Desulfofundulus thermosubterraneus DSM 16057 TaxID=1121432 RepID=A0A1M6H2J2_9FIRM|nr:hypothetical protein [Desulfofundulus thermosubterraneus]SHJ16433.1 hypothetical protein SAMN02745219_01901 [Desulfofundulus thermosubterraneus DSM 16057]
MDGFDAFSGLLSGIDGVLFLFQCAARKAVLFMQGGPVLLVVISVFHMVLRGFLSPFMGRAGASLAALGAVALCIGIFGFRAANDPALFWAVLAWAANAGGAAAAQIAYSLRKGGI